MTDRSQPHDRSPALTSALALASSADGDVDDDGIVAIAAEVDSFDYFEVLGLHRPEGEHLEVDAIRGAFHRFALRFHPDRLRDAEPDVRTAAMRVYVVGAEGYRVLLDPLMRRRYLRQLREERRLRLPAEDLALATQTARGRRSFADVVRSAAAEPFARRADELHDKGALREAHLQLRLAALKEGKNALLEEMMRKLEDELARGGH